MVARLHFARLIGIVYCLLLSPLASAEEVDGLYDTAVKVDSQSSQDLTRATREGLSTVLVRVSGNAELVQQPAIKSAIKNASQYIKQFRYEKRPRLIASEPANVEGEQLYAVIEFEPKLIDATLREAGLPLWSSNRPTVLLWVVVAEGNKRRFANADTDPDLLQAIAANAERRGLAVKLPTLDLEDMVAVSTDQLWQLNHPRANAAVERYQTDTVLLGRVTRLTNGEWLGSWRYSYAGQTIRFDAEATSANDYIAVAVDEVAERLAQQYAIAPVNIADNGVLMRLSGINDFTAYARAISYLESVAAIRHANVVSVEADEIIVRLIADGLLAQLEQSFALDKRIQPQVLSSYQGDYTIALDYAWPAP
ncbi:DUF2066 domain-containing protein [Oceanicoccus sagamiensis]|uniref:DUF2066 domain-containing protein n=1 Tax=Oceanicoccus sagamiensis TaxID=716816 RepID=A0A1X9NBP2_9GAMM|nr:DUF2066 domain-containing protein [Oceanicoccus sagamiensis]ARN72969.1 hypothetical protein BST96_01915 [Oceanicoccus sagamiensis]